MVGGAAQKVEFEMAEEKIDSFNVVIEPLFQDQVDIGTFTKHDFRGVKVLEIERVITFEPSCSSLQAQKDLPEKYEF